MRGADNAFGDAANDDVRESGSPVGTNHDEVVLAPPRKLRNRMGDGPELRERSADGYFAGLCFRDELCERGLGVLPVDVDQGEVGDAGIGQHRGRDEHRHFPNVKHVDGGAEWARELGGVVERSARRRREIRGDQDLTNGHDAAPSLQLVCHAGHARGCGHSPIRPLLEGVPPGKLCGDSLTPRKIGAPSSVLERAEVVRTLISRASMAWYADCEGGLRARDGILTNECRQLD